MISNNNSSNDNTVITGHNEKLTQEHLKNKGEKTPDKRRSMVQPKEGTRLTHRTKRSTQQDKKKEVKKNVEQQKNKQRIPLKKHGKRVENTPNKIAFKNRKKMEIKKKENFGQKHTKDDIKNTYAKIVLRKQEAERQRKKHERFKKNIDTPTVDHFIKAVNAKRKQEAERQRKELERVKKITNDRLLKNINDSVEVAQAKRKQEEVAKKVEPEKELNKSRPPRKNVIVRNLRNAFDLVAGEDRSIETAGGGHDVLKIKKIKDREQLQNNEQAKKKSFFENFTQREKEIIYDKSNIYDSDDKTHPGEVNNLKLKFNDLTTKNSRKIQSNGEDITDSNDKGVSMPKKNTEFKFDEKYFPSKEIKFDKKNEKPKNESEDIKNLKDRGNENNKSTNK